jgi:hypothetical protein
MSRAETRLVERLLAEGGLRRRFEEDPAAVAREAGLPELADELARVDAGDGRRLDVRESRSSAAGVFMAAALEGLGVLALGGSGASDAQSLQPTSDPPLPDHRDDDVPADSVPAAREPEEYHRVSPDSEAPSRRHADREPARERSREAEQPSPARHSDRESRNADPGGSDRARSAHARAQAPRHAQLSDLRQVRASETPTVDAIPAIPSGDMPPDLPHESLPPELPADPIADAAALHLAEYHYGFVRESSSTPDYALLKAAGYNGILFHANDSNLGEAIASARAAGIESVGIWAPPNGEDPVTFAHRLADLETYEPSIVVPDVEIEGKGVPGSPEWEWSEVFAGLYRRLVPNRTWAVTVMPNQDDFNYQAYTSREAQVWPQTYGQTYETTFDPRAVVERVASNGVDPRLINPVLAPNQSGIGLASYASYALEDFQGTFPPFVPQQEEAGEGQ